MLVAMGESKQSEVYFEHLWSMLQIHVMDGLKFSISYYIHRETQTHTHGSHVSNLEGHQVDREKSLHMKEYTA